MFATDWLLVTLVQSVSVLVASVLMEGGLSVGTVVLGLAVAEVLAGVVWLAVIVPAERRGEVDAPRLEAPI